MKGFLTPRNCVVFMLAGLAVLTSCSLIASDESVPFTIVAEGQPPGIGNNGPVLAAVRGDDPKRAVPDGLPDAAQKALKEIFSKSDPALYIVVFDGQAGSTGVRVKIDSVVRHRDTSVERLVIKYHVDAPGQGQGASTAYTYPFVIARVADVTVPAAAVVFDGPPHPTPAVQNLTFETIASGAPTESGGTEPLAFAIRGDDAKATIPEALPNEVRDALQKVLATPNSALYLIIYAGAYPGTDYRVVIALVELHHEAPVDRLVVRYGVGTPQHSSPPSSHPFLIARVKTSVRPGDVMFAHP